MNGCFFVTIIFKPKVIKLCFEKKRGLQKLSFIFVINNCLSSNCYFNKGKIVITFLRTNEFYIVYITQKLVCPIAVFCFLGTK